MAKLFLADTPCKQIPTDVVGEYVVRDGQNWYKISNFDSMEPFFMSIVSAVDFWLFVSSTGGVTCGRTSCEHALFPYYTVDKIHDSYPHTGPKTILIVEKEGKSYLWEPFVIHPPVYKTSRNLYKGMMGNIVTFEEINEDLGLTFCYTWATSDEYGIVRKCKLVNHSGVKVNIKLLDGLQNIMAANTIPWLQDFMSNLLEAYKWNELAEQEIGVFCLYAKQSDRAEPLESLKANTVWQRGLPCPKILLSSSQLNAFRRGESISPETVVRGIRGSFLVESSFDLAAGAEKTWMFVSEVDMTQGTITSLQGLLASKGDAVMKYVESDIAQGALALKKIIGATDGFQCLQDDAVQTHHFANVMFNTMRGGTYDKGYIVDRTDLIAFLKKRNVAVFKKHEAFLVGLPDPVNYLDLLGDVQGKGDTDLIRLTFEYVPITFSRRHGDPSRPWNKFNIVLKDDEGHRVLNYQGNWRDIFQNWEAMTFSFPYYYESIIAKFVDASTVDGYNPYVVTKNEGINWECPEPEHPHANIGYWGDHQIIYLLKLLEWCSRFQPGLLEANCDKDRFSYANVPYEIRPYPKIVENAKDTIAFNWDKHNRIQAQLKTLGADAKLMQDSSGNVIHVNLAEKLLVALLAKVANFVIGGGIWLNTQRPEWNDGNNAIVGFGLSMVTVYYMRRYVHFAEQLFSSLKNDTVNVSEEVATWMTNTSGVLTPNASLLKGDLSSKDRRKILDDLGEAASAYRWQIYEKGLSGKKSPLQVKAVMGFFQVLQQYIDYSIAVSKTPGGLYQSYNILHLGNGTADVSHLYDMLEGQVAVLSSSGVTGESAVAVFKELYASGMYREAQNSFMLYPDRKLATFMERNIIPSDQGETAAVQFCLSNELRSILYKDSKGHLRWNANLCNNSDLKEAVAASPNEKLKDHLPELLTVYEKTFNHVAFTGRSGTMFGFEGLGCIYWHMVSKLVIAAQELAWDAIDNKSPAADELTKYYYEVRGGFGFNKAPAVYGAFPCDPYSHTPTQAGAQQPGMTGQVKEEILARFGELGIRIFDGTIHIQPVLLRSAEFLTATKPFEYAPLHSGDVAVLNLQPGQLGFTYCQCPFVYTKGKQTKIVLHCMDGAVTMDGNVIPKDLAGEIFMRSGKVTQVDVEVNEADLLAY